MKRWAILLGNMALLTGLVAQATLPYQVTDMRLVTFPSQETLLLIQSDDNIVTEIAPKDGSADIVIKHSSLAPTLLDSTHHLQRKLWLRPTACKVSAQTTATGTLLHFENCPSQKLSVTYDTPDFLSELLHHLDPKQAWPSVRIASKTKPSILLAQATQALKQGKTTQAIEQFETLFYSQILAPASLYTVLGNLYIQHGQTAKALVFFASGNHQYPETLSLRLATLLDENNQSEKARWVLDNLLATQGIQPTIQGKAHYMLGQLALKDRAFKQAISEFEQARGLLNTDPYVIYNLALTYERLQMTEKAIPLYEKLLSPASTLTPLAKDQLNRLQSQHPIPKAS